MRRLTLYVPLAAVIIVVAVAGIGWSVSAATGAADNPKSGPGVHSDVLHTPSGAPRQKDPTAQAPQQLPSSCRLPFTPSAVEPSDQQPVSASIAKVNTVARSFGSDGFYYSVYGGVHSPDDWAQPNESPAEGLLIVFRQAPDPCASAAGTGMTLKPTPSPHGAVVLDSVTGDIVAYHTVDGTAGRYNYVAGQYR